MKARYLLIATALAGTIGTMSCKHRVYANTKRPSYPDAPTPDAGTDAAPADGVGAIEPPDDEIYANTKSSLYDDGLAKPPAK